MICLGGHFDYVLISNSDFTILFQDMGVQNRGIAILFLNRYFVLRRLNNRIVISSEIGMRG